MRTGFVVAYACIMLAIIGGARWLFVSAVALKDFGVSAVAQIDWLRDVSAGRGGSATTYAHITYRTESGERSAIVPVAPAYDRGSEPYKDVYSSRKLPIVYDSKKPSFVASSVGNSNQFRHPLRAPVLFGVIGAFLATLLFTLLMLAL